MRKLMIAASLLAMSSAAFAQQAPGPATDDKVTDLQLQLQLTQQQLAGANQNVVAAQSQMIRVGRQINDASSEIAKKDAQIKDLTDKVAAAEAARMKALSPPKIDAPK